MLLRTASCVGAALFIGLLTYPVSYAEANGLVPAGVMARACTGPEAVRMRPTQNAPGGRGTMLLGAPRSPFGITVDALGRQTYEVTVVIEQLRMRDGATYVVWGATPELDEVTRLGVVGEDRRVTGPVAWNKFLVFVSEETDPGVERWDGPIMLTGLSPSGRMHTMAGHGPFEDANCSDFIY